MIKWSLIKPFLKYVLFVLFPDKRANTSYAAEGFGHLLHRIWRTVRDPLARNEFFHLYKSMKLFEIEFNSN